jgi:subtilase-type serine protease
LNTALVTVEAGGTVTVSSLTYSSDGPASSDARTMAMAHASGIDSGADGDQVTNTDTVFVKAAPSISSATRTFGMRGNVDGKVGILLSAIATGITGGEGNDAINNEGNVVVFAGVQETGSTVSENAVSGSTTITDKSFMTVPPQELVGKWIRITGGENPDFFTQVVAFDPQTGTFTLSDPLKYDLSKDAQYVLYDYGDKTPDITSLNVTAGGRTRVDASTDASVRAKGIVGGDGDDQIVNAGTTAVSASNLVKTVTLSFTRNIRADTRIESNVNAVGIEGNDQSSVTDVSEGGTKVFTDLSRKGEDPEAIVGKPVLFESGSSTDFATLVTEFDPDTGTFTLADPLPSGGLMRGDIYTLGGGSDSITNMGAIGVEADSAIDASSWSFSYRGADIEVKGQAQALSAGMRGGEFDDSFQNLGPIVTRSTTDVSSTERVTVKFGEEAEQKLSFEASSSSVGVYAGAGNDEFTNAKNGSIDAEAISTANIEGGVTTTYGAYWLPDPGESKTINLADAIAQSTAVGIDLGAGRDVTSSEGELKVSANTAVTAKAISDFDLFGETDADADAIAQASAWGIKAGSGGDQVFNRNLIQVEASTDATSFAQGSKVGSKDDMSKVTEDSNEGSKTFVDASLIPVAGQAAPDLVGKWVRFLTGENEDFFTRIVGFDPSTGTITIFDALPGDLKAAEVNDNGDVITPADEYTFSAARNGTSASVASALATGIDAGDGNAIVENTGVIRVKAFAKADTAANAFGGQATAQANSSSEARGIRTGTGDDVIRNAGVIDVESEVVTTTSDGSTTEIATATGIDAGNGNNKIANEGLINVTASVAQLNGEAKTCGIITGEGNDTIINEGTISATMIRNGISSLGVGINSGAGNDQIFLTNGSETNGHIDLGNGDDWLTFTGTPLVTGDVTGAAGMDTLVFDGAGSVGFTPMAFENAIKQGAGTYSMASLPTMQRIEIKEGILEVNDNYQFSNNGSFETFVKGDGSFGQFKVNGTTELAGYLNVLKGPGPYTDGTTYNIIEANAVNDAFSNVMLPPPNNFVSFGMNQFPTLVQIEVNVKDFTWLARNRVEWAVANYLDRILPSATGDLFGTLGQIQNLSQSEFYRALLTLSPDSYDNFTRNTFSTTHRYTKSLQYRMNNIRSFLHANGSANEPPILLAYRGSDWGQLLNPERVSQIQGKNGLWFDAFGQWGNQSEESGFRWNGGYVGYDYFMRGATLGFDHALTDKLIAGVNVGYFRADIDLNRHQGSGYIKSLNGSIYGSYFHKDLYIDGVLSYGRNWYDNHRLITIGPIQRKAYSDHDGDLFSAYLGAGYTFDIKRWLIGPFGTLQYTYLDEESFREKGAGGLSLRIDDRQTDSLVSELGIRLARVFNIRYGNLIPELNAAWLHDFDIDDRVITSSFAGSPDASFSMKGLDVERNGASLGAGITLVHKSGLSTFFKYKGEFREKYKSNGVMGEVRFTF